jgi:hypothetical protein
MTPQASPRSSWPPEEGTPQQPALWHQQARAQAWPQSPAYSPGFPKTPTESPPAAWVNAARSKTRSVGPTPQVSRARRNGCGRRRPGPHRPVCRDSHRRRLFSSGADASQRDHLRSDHLRELWRGRDVAVVYAVLVVAISILVAVQPPAVLRDIVQTSSTNLVNLRQRPLAVLFVSPLVISPVSGLWIVAPMVVGYGELQRWLGRGSAVVVGVLGHVGATLFVATMEVTQLAKGRVGFSIAASPDIGVSYGLAAVAGILVARVGPRWRRRYVIASLIVIVGQFLILRNFTGLGHLTAWLIGLAIAVPVSHLTRTQDEVETIDKPSVDARQADGFPLPEPATRPGRRTRAA